MFVLALWTIVLTPPASAWAQEVACGEPLLNPSRDRGLYIWPNCFTRVWHMRVVSGGDTTAYDGAIFSDLPMILVDTVNVGSGDLALGDNRQFGFQLATQGATAKGMDFAPAVDGRLYLDLQDSSGDGVFLGRTRIPVSEFPLRLGDRGKRYNVIVIYTDDQRADTIWSMPQLLQYFEEGGVKFTKAFDGTAFCCPSRASFHAGGLLSKNTGVLTNEEPNGGFAKFNDTDTLATRLQADGYRTLFVGKYMNGYQAGYVPPGWTQFVANNDGPGLSDWNSFFVTAGSSTPGGSELGQINGPIDRYVTDYHRDLVLDFIAEPSEEPFFVLLSPFAPHAPATPAPGDEGLFSDFEPEIAEETDLSDKPAWLSDPKKNRADKAPRPGLPGNQLRSLRSLDRAIGELVAELQALGIENDTVLIFASDDGTQWGEHGLWSKGHQYEASVHVPLLVRFPGVAPRSEHELAVPDIDVPATVLDLAGIDTATDDTDGLSLVPLLLRPGSALRSHVPLARYLDTVWAGVRTERWKYILSATGEEELYDLLNDPDELESLHADPSYTDERDELRAIVEAERGLAALPTPETFMTRIGQFAVIELPAWGGTPPYAWSVESDPPDIFFGRNKNRLTNQDLPYVIPANFVCGKPAIDTASEAGIFLWKECPTDWWHIRVVAGGGKERIVGTLKSSKPFVQVGRHGIGGNDKVDTRFPWRVRFDIVVSGDRMNGIDFVITPGSKTQLDVDTGELPRGLVLDSESGMISGTPEAWSFRSLRLRVRDSSQRKIDGQPQEYVTGASIKVNP